MGVREEKESSLYQIQLNAKITLKNGHATCARPSQDLGWSDEVRGTGQIE